MIDRNRKGVNSKPKTGSINLDQPHPHIVLHHKLVHSFCRVGHIHFALSISEISLVIFFSNGVCTRSSASPLAIKFRDVKKTPKVATQYLLRDVSQSRSVVQVKAIVHIRICIVAQREMEPLALSETLIPIPQRPITHCVMIIASTVLQSKSSMNGNDAIPVYAGCTPVSHTIVRPRYFSTQHDLPTSCPAPSSVTLNVCESDIDSDNS